MQLITIKPDVAHIYRGEFDEFELQADSRYERKLKALRAVIATATLAHKSSKNVRVLCPIV